MSRIASVHGSGMHEHGNLLKKIIAELLILGNYDFKFVTFFIILFKLMLALLNKNGIHTFFSFSSSFKSRICSTVRGFGL